MKKSIFVIDDDVDILEAVEIVLEDEGYAVYTTSKPLSVLNGSLIPDLYMIDIWMSGQNGKDICVALKHSQKTKDIPIILFSANKDTAQIAQEAGADDYILKPFNIDELLTKIRTLVPTD